MNLPALAAIAIKNNGKVPAYNPLLRDGMMILQVGNLPIVVESGKILRTMDTASDQMVVDIPMEFDPSKDGFRPEQIYLTRPYGNEKVIGYLDGIQNFGGVTMSCSNSNTPSGKKRSVTCYSKTVHILDSTPNVSFGETLESNAVSLFQRCVQMTAGRGIGCSVDVNSIDAMVKANIPFPRVSCEPDETIFEHLQKYATQKSLLLSNDIYGDLFITKADTKQFPVAFLSEDVTTFPDGYEINFDGRTRFNQYVCLSQSKNKNLKGKGISLDTKITPQRTKTSKAPNSEIGDIQTAADWERAKAQAQSFTIPWRVNSWYSDPFNVFFWQPNTIVTVVWSPTLNIIRPYQFLIESCEYVFESGGRYTNLQLVPPQARTGEPLLYEPWISPLT